MSDPSRTDALVARTIDFSEADRVCTLLTRAMGKVSALARAARRSRRRFGGALSLFVLGEATLRQGRGELLILERFEAREDFSRCLGDDLLKVAHGSYILELARELWPPGENEPGLFELVVDALRALASAHPEPRLLRAFELKALALCGVLPALERCVGCSDLVAEGPLSLDASRGGVLCPGCAPPGDLRAAAARAALLQLLHEPLGSAGVGRREDPAVARAMRDLLLQVIRNHLGRDLQSVRFIAQLATGRERPS